MAKTAGMGMVMGAALGLLVDVVFGTLPFGIIFGPGLGLVLGMIFLKGGGTDSPDSADP
jgi:F0F1-type ATP synthase assembly protein I